MKLLLFLAFVDSALGCSENTACLASEYCKAGLPGAASGVCTADQTAGMSCTSFRLQRSSDDKEDICAGSLECISSTCYQVALLGESCSSSYRGTPCKEPYVCSADFKSDSSGLCVQKVASGEACTDTLLNQKQCVDGYYCSSATQSTAYMAGTCTAKIDVGGACTNDVQCAGSFSSCSEAEGNCVGISIDVTALKNGLAMATGVIVAIVIIPIVVCICCCVILFMMMKKKKSSDDD